MHGFFTREGGVSEGIYRGLNVGLGSQDDRDAVLENRRRVVEAMDIPDDNLVTAYQIHSPDVVHVDSPWKMDDRPRVDAMVTSKPDIAIGILTADCGPVLFADHENGIVGAAHAGWKGATGGVLENTLQAMQAIGADATKIKAVLGPTISQANYEVGPEFVERLLELDDTNSAWLIASEKPGHAKFDLPGYIVNRLEKSGIEASWCGECTYADEARFFSYRRTTHRNEPDYGRQVSVIKLNR